MIAAFQVWDDEDYLFVDITDDNCVRLSVGEDGVGASGALILSADEAMAVAQMTLHVAEEAERRTIQDKELEDEFKNTME